MALPSITEPEIGAFIAALLRCGALAMTAPVIGDGGVPARAKVILATAVAIAVAANRPGVAFAELPEVAFVELAAGLVTGLTASFVLARVAVGGQLIGLALGLGFAQEFDANAGESAGVTRTLASTLAGLAFLGAHGLEAIVRGVLVPAGGVMLGSGSEALVAAAVSAFGHGLALAAPIVLAALVAHVGLAVMNRAAPAMNVFSISLGAVLAIGTSILLATSGTFVLDIAESARQAAQSIAG